MAKFSADSLLIYFLAYFARILEKFVSLRYSCQKMVYAIF